MGGIYQLTFFLALGLLAIVVTVFVFAVSLLGRAMKAAAAREMEMKAEQKANNAKEMDAIKKEIEEAQAKGKIPRRLGWKLKRLEKREKKFEKELSKTRRVPELLTVKGGVVHPGAFLGTALILTGVASHLSSIGIPTVPAIIWGLGLAAIVYSIRRIYHTLKVVESTAITSEEAALKRTIEAFKIAQRELEEEKKPELALAFDPQLPPFHISCGAQIGVHYCIFLARGEVARKPEVAFFAPPGFDFPGRDTWLQPQKQRKVGDYTTTSLEYEDLRKGVILGRTITIKAPSSSGSFTLKYSLVCEGFVSDFQEFEVVVE